MAGRAAVARRDRGARRGHRLVVDGAGAEGRVVALRRRDRAARAGARRLAARRALRRTIEVRDAWAEPDRKVERLFCGFWLSHVPRDRLARVPGHLPALAEARRLVRVHRFAAATRSRARAIIPRPADDLSLRRLQRRPRVHDPQGLLRTGRTRGRRYASGFAGAKVTTTARFFLLGEAHAAA